MKEEDLRKKILAEDDFVVAELKRVQVLYKLKRVVRYGGSRSLEADTESVAEHIFAMHLLIDYFLPLEDVYGVWNKEYINRLAQYHDIGEIETGDLIGYQKVGTDCAREVEAVKKVVAQLPFSMQTEIREVVQAYQEQVSIESKFVKAIDKIEPVFHLYNEAGQATLARLKTTHQQHASIKEPYVQSFPYLKRFSDVMTKQYDREGYFTVMSC